MKELRFWPRAQSEERNSERRRLFFPLFCIPLGHNLWPQLILLNAAIPVLTFILLATGDNHYHRHHHRFFTSSCSSWDSDSDSVVRGWLEAMVQRHLFGGFTRLTKNIATWHRSEHRQGSFSDPKQTICLSIPINTRASPPWKGATWIQCWTFSICHKFINWNKLWDSFTRQRICFFLPKCHVVFLWSTKRHHDLIVEDLCSRRSRTPKSNILHTFSSLQSLPPTESVSHSSCSFSWWPRVILSSSSGWHAIHFIAPLQAS